MKNKLLIIIPLHHFNDDVKPLLENAIKSVPSNIDIALSIPKSIKDDVEKGMTFSKNVKIVSNENNSTAFSDLVNAAVDENYNWFSILEFDDEYTPIWFDNVDKYIDYKSDYSVFIPLEDLVDYKKNEYLGIGNVAPWASSFSNEIGVIDLDCLQNYFEFYLTGAVFNTKDWKEIGGLKNNIPIYFWYEFVLRAANKGKKIFVIPKVGYTHYVGREGSLLEIYKNSIGEKEAKYWMSVAKKEYFFVEQREVKPYNPDMDSDDN